MRSSCRSICRELPEGLQPRDLRDFRLALPRQRLEDDDFGLVGFGAEVAVGKHSTLGFSANYNPWTIGSDNKIQHWFIRPEYRYWVTEKYTRLFFGVHAIGGKFEVGGFKLPFIGDKVFKGLQTNYYKGSFVGAGISIGYQFYVSPHWNLELSAGAGLARLSYHAEPVSGPKRSSYVDSKRFLPIPTEIGVTFVYLFNSKK